MQRNPAMSATVVLTLALGIGANTAMFSVIRAVLLKPLQYREPERVVLVSDGATPIRFEEFTTASRSYTELGAFANGFEQMALSGSGEPEVLKAARVSANFLRILGVSPARGRNFLPEEDKPGAPPVAMISAGLWQRRFGNDASIVGKTVALAGLPHVIVGVLPAGFEFPLAGTDVWLTRPAEWSVIPPQNRQISPILSMFGRLRPGADLAQATAELAVLNRQYAAAHPDALDTKEQPTGPVRALRDVLVEDVRPKLWLLLGALGFVLLIVCANTASLLLARATSRSREFAVRAAIGAGRGRILRQLLAESIILAFFGGAFGIALAAGSLGAIRRMTFVDLPRSGEVRMDAAVLAFGAVLTLCTGLAFGLVPALSASKTDLAGVLRGSGESAAGSKPMTRLGWLGFLVVGQVTLSIVLLIGATLLIESLARLYRVDPGFQPSGLLTMNIALSPALYDTDQKKAAFYEQLVQRAEAVAGVQSAAVTLTLPVDEFMGTTVQVTGRPPVALNDRPIAIIQDITTGYFQTLQIPLKRGRKFNAHDNASAGQVTIVSEAMARVFWPEYPAGVDPIGQHILAGTDTRPFEIVGVAADVHQTGRDQDPRPEVYFPCAQKPPQSAMLAVRTKGDPLSLSREMRDAVLAIDRNQPVSEISTMTELDEASEGPLRLIMRLLGAFAGVATALAVIGLYGVISYSVVRRTREIGIRRALGAQNRDVLSLLLKRGLVLSASGALLGACAALALTRLLRDLLFQVSPTDPMTFVGVAVLFVVVALAASFVPARRAAAMDPLVAIRTE